MKIVLPNTDQFNTEKVFDELFILESMLKLLKKSQLFELLYNDNFTSDTNERNDYINIINIALEKVNSLKELNCKLEKITCYSSTPTMAADK